MKRKSARDRYLISRTQKPKEGSGGKLGRGSEVQENQKRNHEVAKTGS